MKCSHLRVLSIGLIMLALIGLTSAESQTLTPRYISMSANSHGFYEYLPKGYDPAGTTKYPLIIFIHGIGEVGPGTSATLPAVLKNGTPHLINTGTFPTSFTVNGKTYSFIVITPQFSAWPGGGDIDQIITYAETHYHVDASKVYLTGLSMGGGVTWDYASANSATANRLAAIVPVCGASWPDPTKARVLANANLPVWALQNSGDGTVSPTYTINWIAYINTAPYPNPLARKTMFNATGHNAWSKAYDPNYTETINGENQNVYTWMLSYSRGGSITPPPNQPPVVNAGSKIDLTLPSNSTQLNATASDPDGSIAAYSWKQTAGPAQYTLSSTTISKPTLSNLIAGTYTFRVTVTDNKGATAYSDVSITVNAQMPPPNKPPVVSAGSKIDLTLPSNSTQLNATASDPDGSIAAYSWKQIAGPAKYTLSSTTIAKPTLSNLIAGNYTFRVTVTDNKGASAYSDVSIIVNQITKTTSGVHIPGKIEAESFDSKTGTSSILTCTEGGEQIGSIGATASWSYNVTVDTAGTYTVGFRVASPVSNEQIQLRNSANNVLATINIPNTGNWNKFATVTATVSLPAGDQTLKVYAITGNWNFNWMQFTKGLASIPALATVQAKSASSSFSIYPSTVQDKFELTVNTPNTGNMLVTISDATGTVKQTFNLTKDVAGTTQTYLSIGTLATGNYTISVSIGQWSGSQNFTKQ